MRHLAAGDFLDALNGIFLAGVDDILDAKALGEVQALLHEVEQDGVSTVSLGNHTGNQADGACTDDSAVLAGLQAAAMDAVQADGQGFGHSGLLPAHALGDLDEHISGVAVVLSHAAVYMHTQNLQVGAAVGTADAAGIAVAAVQVRIHYNTVADFDAVLVVLRDGFHRNQTIGAAESTDVTAADAGGDHLDQSLAGFRHGLFNVNARDFPRLSQLDCLHDEITTFL